MPYIPALRQFIDPSDPNAALDPNAAMPKPPSGNPMGPPPPPSDATIPQPDQRPYMPPPNPPPPTPDTKARMPGARAFNSPSPAPAPAASPSIAPQVSPPSTPRNRADEASETAAGAVAGALAAKPPTPPPPPGNPKWYQRLAAAVEGAAGGYVNASRRTYIDPKMIEQAQQNTLYPGYAAQQSQFQQQMGNYQAAQDDALAKAKLAESLENVQGLTQQRQAKAQSLIEEQENRGQKIVNARQQDLDKRQDAQNAAILGLKGKNPIPTMVFPDDATPDQIEQGWVKVPVQPVDLKSTGMVQYMPAVMTDVPEELQTYLPGQDRATRQELAIARASLAKQKEIEAKAKAKPPAQETAAQEKLDVEHLMARAQIPLNTAQDLGALEKALVTNTHLTPEEKNKVRGHFLVNASPQASDTAAMLRAMILSNTMLQRNPLAYVDQSDGTIVVMNADEVNRANQTERGRFVPYQAGQQIMSKQALFNDIEYNINNARRSINAIGSLDPQTRAGLAAVLASDRPRGSLDAFLHGEAGKALLNNPQAQDLAISLASLGENAMSLRGLGQFGQGSQDVREAIRSTLPGVKSADVDYMLKQLDRFAGVVTRLRAGVPRTKITPPGLSESSSNQGNLPPLSSFER